MLWRSALRPRPGAHLLCGPGTTPALAGGAVRGLRAPASRLRWDPQAPGQDPSSCGRGSRFTTRVRSRGRGGAGGAGSGRHHRGWQARDVITAGPDNMAAEDGGGAGAGHGALGSRAAAATVRELLQDGKEAGGGSWGGGLPCSHRVPGGGGANPWPCGKFSGLDGTLPSARPPAPGCWPGQPVPWDSWLLAAPQGSSALAAPGASLKSWNPGRALALAAAGRRRGSGRRVESVGREQTAGG